MCIRRLSNEKIYLEILRLKQGGTEFHEGSYHEYSIYHGNSIHLDDLFQV